MCLYKTTPHYTHPTLDLGTLGELPLGVFEGYVGEMEAGDKSCDAIGDIHDHSFVTDLAHGTL